MRKWNFARVEDVYSAAVFIGRRLLDSRLRNDCGCAPLSSGFAGPSPSSGRRALFSSSQLLAPLRRGFFPAVAPRIRLITTRRITRAPSLIWNPNRWPKRANNAHANLWFRPFGRNNFLNFFPLPVLFWRDVNSGDLAMSIALTRSGTVTGDASCTRHGFQLL